MSQSLIVKTLTPTDTPKGWVGVTLEPFRVNALMQIAEKNLGLKK